ncbi:hypothetical protein HK102_004663 [Quaeritorhiza haematococci]|nr:hypothetical protein HK102_004663 [Quaeritorhiza haematococci]
MSPTTYHDPVLAFTNWINNKLKLKNVAPIANLDTELSSGEKLIQLLEIIGDESLGRYNKNPKLRIQKVENMNTALAYIKKRGVPLTNIGAEDVVDSNVKLILGLVWSIILRFTIADISEEGLTAKEGLLLWVQKRTVPYNQDFFVKDFTFSCALIHRHRPDLLDYWKLDKSKKHENTALAFEVAEQHLGIPKLFGVEDIVDVAKPDERSVMTYVAQYFHAFSAMDKVGTAGRRVGQFGQVMSQVWEMQHDYERRVRQLMNDIGVMQGFWSRSVFQNYPDAKRQLLEFENYKSTTKRSWVVEKRDLDTLLGNIQTKLATYNLTPYNPPQGLTLRDLENVWEGLIRTEGERKRSITAYIREIKEVLKSKYANAANKFQSDLNQISLALASVEGELETQLQVVQRLMMELEPLKNNLRDLEKLNAECIEANIEDNEYTIYSVEDLSFDLGILSQSLLKKSAFIENQIVARGVTNLTPQQLDGYTETFRHFDKDHRNSLGKEEFRAALQAEGLVYPDNEFESKIWPNASRGSSAVVFQQFIDFMKTIAEDRTTPEQLKVSFQALAGDKGYITESDMYMGALPPQVVEYFKQALPRKAGMDNGFDYNAYLAQVFGGSG